MSFEVREWDLWAAECFPEIIEASKVLDEATPDDPGSLDQYANRVKSAVISLARIKAEAEHHYQLARHRAIGKREPGDTEEIRRARRGQMAAPMEHASTWADNLLRAGHAVLIDVQSRRRAFEKEWTASRD